MARLLLIILASSLANAANASNVAGVVKVTPLEKVIELLEGLKQKVSEDGVREAKTYDAFACFCKDAADEKTKAVDKGQGLKDKLQADLSKLASDREGKDVEIAGFLKRIGSTRTEMKVMKKERREQQLRYEGNEVDMSAGIEGLQGAIRMLKATKNEVGLLELAPIRNTLRKSLMLAQGLEVLHQPSPQMSRILSALEVENEAPDTVYSFHADDIVDTLEKLLKDFQARKHDLDQEESDAKESYDKSMSDRSKAIKDDEEMLKAAQHEKAGFSTRIAAASEDLTTTSAQLLDDQKYLADLTTKCSSKAKTWDQRSKLRAEELQALAKAITIMQSDPVSTPSDGDEDEFEEDGEVFLQSRGANFLQLASTQPHLPHRVLSILSNQERSFSPGQRNEVVMLLRAKAQDLKSSVLASLATQAAKDPFGKIKTMIQNLIERLLKQAASEAAHKGWCDKEMGLAKQARDRRATEIKDLNARMQSGEARRDKLNQLLTVLNDELDALKEMVSDSKEMREEESAENAEAIKDAEEGRDAVAQAIDHLTKFYKTAAKAGSASALIAVAAAPAAAEKKSVAASGNVDNDAPDAGFDGAYTGAQGAKEGVLGMLEVIQGDFDRQVQQTKAAEKAAAQDFLEFETTQGSSIAEKEEARKSRQRSLDECLKELADNTASFKDAQAGLDKALNELMALHPACVGEPTTAEERKMQREQEIGALRQALCSLASNDDPFDKC